MTVRPIRAFELLDIAYELAGAGAGPGKPKTAKLRRSISTSYYALFHELAYSAACLLCGEGGVAEGQRNRVVRWIAHTDVLALVQAARDPKRPIAGVLLRPAPDLLRVADAFVDLQESRERADYAMPMTSTGQRRWSRPTLRVTLLAVPVICGTLRKRRTCRSFG